MPVHFSQPDAPDADETIQISLTKQGDDTFRARVDAASIGYSAGDIRFTATQLDG